MAQHIIGNYEYMAIIGAIGTHIIVRDIKTHVEYGDITFDHADMAEQNPVLRVPGAPAALFALRPNSITHADMRGDMLDIEWIIQFPLLGGTRIVIPIGTIIFDDPINQLRHELKIMRRVMADMAAEIAALKQPPAAREESKTEA